MNQKLYTSKSWPVIKWLTCSLFLLAGLWTTNSYAQCTTAAFGQWPASTFTPTCTGADQTIVSDAFASEYSVLALTAGTYYRFTCSTATDILTITDATGVTVYTFAIGNVLFLPPATANYRFYRHTSGCGSSSTNRTITVNCGFTPQPCINSPNGQWPGSTYTPSCTGSAETIVTDAFEGEYSVVNLTAGTAYTFNISLATDIITIANSAGTFALATGVTPVTFNPATSGTYRFYRHLASACGSGGTNRTITVTCVSAAPTITSFTPNTNLCSAGGQTVTITGTNFSGASAVTFNLVNATSFVVVNSTTITAVTPAGIAPGQVRVTTPSGTAIGGTYTVAISPTVSVSPTSSTICSPGSAAVVLTAGGTSTAFSWSPATGLSATTGTPVNALPTATTTYTVTGSDVTGCSATATASITVNNAPSICDLTATPSSVCSGANSQLNVSGGTSAAANTYTFSSGTGTVLNNMTGATQVLNASNDDTPTGAPASIGFNFNFNGTSYSQYSVSPDGWILLGGATAVSQFNNVVTSTSNIPKIYPYWDDMATGTTGNVKTLVTGTAPNRIFIVQWFVTIPRNTSGAANSTFQCWLYECGGKIEFRYGAMGPGSMSASVGLTGSATNFQSVTISPLGVSTVTANDLNSVQPASGDIYTFSTPSPTWSWSPATFLNSTSIANPLATGVTANTTYTVTATGANGCTSTSTVTITAGVALTCGTISQSPSVGCSGSNFTLTANPLGGGAPFTYLWSDASTTASITQNLAAGSYTYTVTVADNCGATCSSSNTVVVNQTPTASVTPVGPLTLCPENLPAVLNAASFTNSSFTEGFNAGTTGVGYTPAGWVQQNNSAPGGGFPQWSGGDNLAFNPHSGAGYIFCNFGSTSGNNDISNWLITPNLNFQNGDVLTFWTRTVDSPAFPDRLQVRLSTNGSSTNVGSGAAAVGDFTTLLLDINPTLTTSGYPNSWTQYTVTLSGLSGPTSGRFAFRYFVTNGGPNGANSDYIGLDDVQFTSNISYSYNWSNGATTQSISANASGNYSVTVSQNGCSAISNTVSLTVSPAQTPISASATPASICSGSSSQLLAIGQVASAPSLYSFTESNDTYTSISGTASTATGDDGTESGLPIGFNFDYNGATHTTFSLTTNGAITLTNSAFGGWWTNNLNTTNTNILGALWDDNNQSGGSIQYATTGSVGSRVLTVQWDNIHIGGGGSSSNPTGSFQLKLYEGTNRIQFIYGALNAFSSVSASIGITGAAGNFISVTPAPVSTSSNAVANNAISSATDLPSGKTYTFAPQSPTFSWSPATYLNSNSIANPVASGVVANTTYTITATNPSGCTASVTTSITVNIVAANCSGTNVSCFGGNNGSASVSASGGTPGYSYLWSNANTNSSITGLPAGTYCVTVTDAAGCSATCCYTVTEPTQLTATAGATNASCPLCPDGTVSINSTSGGTPSYTFTNLTGLLPGNYCITVTDANGCTTSACATVGAAGCTLNANGSQTAPVSCFGGNNGVAASNPTGAIIGPLSYAWSNGATTASVSGLAAGNYTVVVSDLGSGCVAQSVVTITQPTALAANCSGTNVSCNGGSNGTASVTGAGGTQFPSSSTVTYLMNGTNLATAGFNIGCGPGTQAYAQSLTGPDYGFTWIDGLSPASTITNISLETSFYLNCNSLNPRVVNLNGLFAGTTPVAGTQCSGCGSPIAVNSGNLNAGIANYIKGGSNTLKYVIDFVNFEGLIANPAWSSTDNIYARLHVTATTPGGGGYTYLWSNGSTNASVSGLSAGTYTVTVTDANGCTATCVKVVSQPAPVSATGTSTNVVCAESPTGSINLTPSGGTSPYTYLWNNGSTVEDPSDLTIGTYTVVITDAIGCTGTYSGTVNCTDNIPPTLSVGPGSGTPLFENFEAGVLPAGWSATGLWHVTASCPTGTPPNPTKWAYYGQDATCTYNNGSTNSGNLTSPTVSIPASASSAKVRFRYIYNGEGGAPPSGFDNASVRISVNGGAFVQAGSLSTNGTSIWLASEININSAIGGTIALQWNFSTQDGIANDFLGLQVDSVAITYVNLQQCPNNIVTVNDPGVCGTTVSWTAPTATDNCLVSLTSNKNPGDFFPVGTTVVTYTATDGCGNATSCSFNVTVNQVGPPILNISHSNVNVDCQGANTGSIDLTVSGGATPYTYQWNNGSTTEDISNLFVGVYTVTVTEANGCSATYSVTIGNNPALQASETHVNVLCNGDLSGSIDISAVNGKPAYNYLWNDGTTNEDRTGLGAGTYTVTVSDQCGTTQVLTIAITQPGALALAPVVVDATCFGVCDGSIAPNVSGGAPGYSYSWSNGATTSNLNNLCAGSYSLTVTDANGCSITGSYTITEPAQLFINESHVDVACYANNSGSINLTLTGGTPPFSFLWSNSATTEDLTNIPASNYFVTVTQGNGCTATLNVIINQPTALVVSSVNVSPTSLLPFSGSITTTVSGGTTPYTYAWNNGSTMASLSGLTAGTYVLTVTDANGCTQNLSVTLTLSCNLSATNIVVQNASCYQNNGVVTVVASGATSYQYAWQTSPVQTTATGTGLAYGFNSYCIITDPVSGCSIIDTVVVPHLTGISVLLSSPVYAGGVNIRCFGGSDGAISAVASGAPGPYSYLWNNGATTASITGLSAGTYKVTVTVGGCKAISSINLIQPSDITLVTSKTNAGCGVSNGKASVNASGGVAPYTYSWNTAPVQTTKNATGLAPGSYTVTVGDANGCTKTAVVVIGASASLNVTGVSTDVSCFGGTNGTITLTVSGGLNPYTYLWSNGSTTKNKLALAAGTYTVTVTSANGCVGTYSATISQPTALIATTTSTAVSCNGGNNGTATVAASGGTPGYTYLWNTVPVQTLATATGLSAGSRSCTITDSKGCVKIVVVTIAQPAKITLAIAKVNVTTFGGNNGSATANAGGGVTPYSYLWNNGQTTQTAIGLIAGTYSVTVTDANGCTKSGTTVITQPPARLVGGVNNDEVNSIVFPNPTNGQVTVSFDQTIHEKVTMEVYTMAGEVVFNKDLKVDGTTNSFNIDLTDLPKGIYAIRYTTNEKQWMNKLVIK